MVRPGDPKKRGDNSDVTMVNANKHRRGLGTSVKGNLE